MRGYYRLVPWESTLHDPAPPSDDDELRRSEWLAERERTRGWRAGLPRWLDRLTDSRLDSLLPRGAALYERDRFVRGLRTTAWAPRVYKGRRRAVAHGWLGRRLLGEGLAGRCGVAWRCEGRTRVGTVTIAGLSGERLTRAVATIEHALAEVGGVLRSDSGREHRWWLPFAAEVSCGEAVAEVEHVLGEVPAGVQVGPRPGELVPVPGTAGFEVGEQQAVAPLRGPIIGEIAGMPLRALPPGMSLLEAFALPARPTVDRRAQAYAVTDVHCFCGRRASARYQEEIISQRNEGAVPRHSSTKGDFGALIERLERDGVDEGLRVEQVTALAWWYARTTDGGVEDVVSGILAWWDRTCGGSSKDAARDWRRTRVDVERLARWKAKRTLTEKAPKLPPRFSTPPVPRTVIEKLRAVAASEGCSEWLESLCELWAWLSLRLKDGRGIVAIHASNVWCELAGSDARDYVGGIVGYKRLQAAAVKVLRMAKTGGYRVGVHAQRWVVARLMGTSKVEPVQMLRESDGCDVVVSGDRWWLAIDGAAFARASLAEVAWAIRAGPAAMIGA